jgi:energy-coupling factor transporter ATP-binding protein EcfA2
MYISHIELRNIRGFETLNFSLDRGHGEYAGWTVFVGGNGSGKSTLLKAIAITQLPSDVSRVLVSEFDKWIRGSQEQATVILSVLSLPGEGYLSRLGGPPLTGSLHDKLIFRVYSKPSISPTRSGSFDFHCEKWFSCGYGPFRRVSGAAQDVQKVMSLPTAERFVTMFQDSASLAEADQWLRQLNYKKLENKPQAAQTLALVLDVLCDEFLPNQITVERVDSDGLWLKDRNGVALSWQDMSDGYRSALAMLADILRHMIHFYGVDGLTARDGEGRLYINRSGVVLIDEVDAHLHPSWQREIGFWLKRHFPKVQFLVTSHSPLVCQAADLNGIFVLPDPGSHEAPRALTPEEYQTVISSKSDTILRSPAFGLPNTRSDMVVAKRVRYAELKNRQRRLNNLLPEELAELVDLARYINPDED